MLEEFIQRAKYRKGFENSVRFAEKSRALGLGVLGWHTYLQEKGLPFEGLLSQYETRRIFSQIKIESERASMALADVYGEPLWCVGTGLRNTHLRAIAPTVSNSKLSGNVSPGIEPWAANVFTEQSAKGTFIRKNPTLQKALDKRGLNTKEVWDKILADGGSVQDIKGLVEDICRAPADRKSTRLNSSHPSRSVAVCLPELCRYRIRGNSDSRISVATLQVRMEPLVR